MSAIHHATQRVGIFIDTQNLYHSARNLFGARVNFGAIVKAAVGERNLIRAIAYVITTESGEEKAFIEALEKSGIEIRSKDLQIFYGGAKKADWDVGLAVDAIKLSSKLDVVVVVSGDGDFVPLMEYLKAQGVRAEAMAFGKTTSSKLRESADHFIDMSEEPGTFLIRSSKARRLGGLHRSRGMRPSGGASANGNGTVSDLSAGPSSTGDEQ